MQRRRLTDEYEELRELNLWAFLAIGLLIVAVALLGLILWRVW